MTNRKKGVCAFMGKTEKKPAQRLVTAVAAGVAAALAVTFLAMLICAAAISAGLLGMEKSWQMTIAACALGGLIGGLIAVRRFGHRALPTGLGTGLLFFLILMAAGLLMFENAAPGLHQLPLLCVCLCAGALAGLLGKKRKKRRN